ncbi:hypothetical protein GCM10010387_50310 [Streptomyces inusitatus]|uniref:Uncharacterized protein n=1 Tax=Streptomyces inusitatus TaxID=68221 RepID=A0A918V0C3_9ACTN|nr:hypothetical protein GCM10010387_50310 [Streptomyces inusitatus]
MRTIFLDLRFGRRSWGVVAEHEDVVRLRGWSALVAGVGAEDQRGREPLGIAFGEMRLKAQSGYFAE